MEQEESRTIRSKQTTWPIALSINLLQLLGMVIMARVMLIDRGGITERVGKVL